MLGFTEWQRAIWERKMQIDELDNRMKYRKMKIRGSQHPDARHLNREPSDIYASDKELIELDYKRHKLLQEIDYLENVGEYPPDAPVIFDGPPDAKE